MVTSSFVEEVDIQVTITLGSQVVEDIHTVAVVGTLLAVTSVEHTLVAMRRMAIHLFV